MDRGREAKRVTMVGSNGFNRRNYRTNNFRDSQDEDMGIGLHETVRLRDRDGDVRTSNLRKRDLRERANRTMNIITRRRNERLKNNRGVTTYDETSEESVTDDEDDEVEDSSSPTTASRRRHHHHHRQMNACSVSRNNTLSIGRSNSPHLEHRRVFPPPKNISAATSKAFRAPPPLWRSGDEVISVSVPRKARSSCTKRTHELISSSNGGEQILRRPSDSPARYPSTQPPTMRKKLKPAVKDDGPNLKPAKAAPMASSSNAEEIEIEIAEVLSGLMMTQPQGGPSPPSKNDDVTRESSTTTTTRDFDQTPKSEILSPLNSDKASPSTVENGSEVGGSCVFSRAEAAALPPERKPFAGGKLLVAKKVTLLSQKGIDCSVVRTEVSTSLPTANSKMYKEEENDKEERFKIDLMAPPLDVKPVLSSANNAELKPTVISKNNKDDVKEEQNQEKKRKWSKENNDGLKIDLRFDLKPERDLSDANIVSKLPKFPAKANEDQAPGKHGQSISQLRSKRCITHRSIANYIYYDQQQQLTRKTNNFPPSLGGPKPYYRNLNDRNPNKNVRDESQNPNASNKIPSQPSNISDYSSQGKQQVLAQQVAPNSLMGPAFIFPVNQQKGNGSSSPQSTTPMAFNHPNVGPSDAHYFALQNNGYAFPMFNASFYPHQLQQKSNEANIQQRPQKSQKIDQQKMNGGDGLESRLPAVSIYGQNFTVPLHPQNFGLPSAAAFSGGGNNQTTTQQKNARASIDGKDDKDDERKGMAGDRSTKMSAQQNAYYVQSQMQKHQKILNLKLRQQQFASANQSSTMSTSPLLVQPPLKGSGSPNHQIPRSQTQMNAQISFGGNRKANASSPTMMAGSSPTTSSISKEGAGKNSPRRSFSSSTNGKNSHGCSASNMLTSQSHKPPSILGSPSVNSSPSSKKQLNSLPQLPAKNMQQQAQQLFFSSPMVQVQSPSHNSFGPSGCYVDHQQQPKRSDKNQQLLQATTTANGVLLSLNPSLASANGATIVGNGKNGFLPSNATVQSGAVAFPYTQSKPTEQKQPAGGALVQKGNDNLHTWQPKKK